MPTCAAPTQQLAADGIVDVFRHKGAVIKSLSVRETLDVLDVAERMTSLLARSAAHGDEVFARAAKFLSGLA